MLPAMKRFLFLTSGALLLLLAVCRLVFLIGVYASAPDNHAATAHIRLDKQIQLCAVTKSSDTQAGLGSLLSSHKLAAVCRAQGLAEFFAKDLGDIKPSERDTVQMLAQRVRLEENIAQNEILLTYHSADPEHAMTVGNALAAALAEEFQATGLTVAVLRAEKTQLIHHRLAAVTSPPVLISIGLAILGTVLVLIGRRWPATLIETTPSAAVVQPKY